MAGSEMLLLACSLASLLLSAVLWSAHKQVWMDEIFTWKEVSDRSLWHLYHAILHGADGGQPFFYTTAWLWAKLFGTGVLTLRLYSSVAICGALLVVWITLRRFYGLWSTAVGVLFFWGTSNVVLDQNVEARFYGLYLLIVALTVNLFTRLAESDSPSRLLLFLSFVSQAALVLTHVLGVVFSGLILLALVLVDAAKRRFRIDVYLVYVAGWLALLLWVPAIRASMAAGKPHGWIAMPTVTDLRTAYLFANSLQWLRLFKRHSMEWEFQVVSRSAELCIYLPLLAVFFFGVRRVARMGWRSIASPRGSLLLLAYLMLCAPIILFVLSMAVTPVFVPRYFLPSGIGLAIVLTSFADGAGADSQNRLRWIWVTIVALLLASPVLTVFAVGPINLGWAYLDIPWVEQLVPKGLPVVAGSEEDFVKLMRLGTRPNGRYYFLLDWPAALVGPRAFVLDYNLMKAYRENGYYADQIVDSHAFLCAHTDFVVLDAPNANTLDGDASASNPPDMQKPNWFDVSIRTIPEFQWKVIGSLDATEVTRKIILVHRAAFLPFCSD